MSSRMSIYEPNSRHLQGILTSCFNMKKYAAEAHLMVSNTCEEDAISERTYCAWFYRFNTGYYKVEHRRSGVREKVSKGGIT